MSARIETSWLELLVALGETGSLTAAAHVLGLAQPNVSRKLTAIERHLGVELFLRGARGSVPTPAGRVAISRAARILEDAETFVEEVRAAAGTGSARIMASQTVSESLMPRFLASLSAHEPGMRMTFEVGNSREVLNALRRRQIDLGFIEGPSTPQGVEGGVIGTDRLVVVVTPGHPWATRPTISAHDLAATPLVCREDGSGTREVLQRALAPLSMAPPALEVHSNAAVRTAVLSGVAPTVISELAVSADLNAGRLIAVAARGINLRRRLLAVWNPPRQERFTEALAHLRLG